MPSHADMGYKETAHMLVESGLVLALDQDKAPKLYGGQLFAPLRCSEPPPIDAARGLLFSCPVPRPSRRPYELLCVKLLVTVLTPASAFGNALLRRLRETGMTFEVLPPGSPLPQHIRPPKEEL